MGRSAKHPIPQPSSAAPAWPSDAPARRCRSQSSSGSRRAGARRRPDLALVPRTPRQGVQIPAKANRGRVLVEREPGRRLASASCRHIRRTTFTGTRQRLAGSKPAPPMRARGVADVGDRRATELRRSRHAPAHRLEPALALGDADDRRHLIREHVGERRQVAGQVARDGEETAHGLLGSGDRVKVAHAVTDLPKSWPSWLGEVASPAPCRGSRGAGSSRRPDGRILQVGRQRLRRRATGSCAGVPAVAG